MALNGQFPSTMLAYLGWPEADHLQLVPAAAASLNRLAAKFERDHGRPLYITDAYRTLASQKALKVSKGSFAAKPGTSNHGLGLAIDMASRINVDGSAEHLWMSVHGPEFGWINPYWATDFNPANGQHEPWHWEFDYRLDRSAFAQATPISHATPAPLTPIDPQEDDMPTIVNAGPAGTYLLDGGRVLGIDESTAAEARTNGCKTLTISRDRYLEWIVKDSKVALFRDPRGNFAINVGKTGFSGISDMTEVDSLRAQGLPLYQISVSLWDRMVAGVA